MRTFLKIFIPVVVIAGTIIVLSAFKKAVTLSNVPVTGFALIELFTSEGCSSCPAADALVARIGKESAGKPVYILAYHVDYWDRLGWKDPFSSKLWSQRQGEYSKWFQLNGVYTPQVVVNGKTEFVGSDEAKMRKAIAASQQTSTPALLVQLNKLSPGIAALNYTYSGAGHNKLFLACVQKSAVIKVERGENGGRTLTHTNIVQRLQSFAINAGQEVFLNVPKDFDPKTWDIIAFVQDTTTGEIMAATSAAETKTHALPVRLAPS